MPQPAKYRTVLLVGAPGAGKGTQGKILGYIPHFFHFASGDAFRNLPASSPLGRVFLEYASKGQLVPDEPTIRLWRDQIAGSIAAGHFRPATDTLLLDGIPRNPRQAAIMQDYIEVMAVLNLACPVPERLVARIQHRALRENRLDDANLDVICHRLEVYKRETRAVLDFYPERIVHNIDSTQTPVEVLRDILNTLVRLPTPPAPEEDPPAVDCRPAPDALDDRGDLAASPPAHAKS